MNSRATRKELAQFVHTCSMLSTSLCFEPKIDTCFRLPGGLDCVGFSSNRNVCDGPKIFLKSLTNLTSY
jgi:hypothetical protein